MMEIGKAVEHLKNYKRVAREGWNGKDMYLTLVAGNDMAGVGTMPYHDFVAMMTVQGMMVPWLCSQTDLLANDWEIVE